MPIKTYPIDLLKAIKVVCEDFNHLMTRKNISLSINSKRTFANLIIFGQKEYIFFVIKALLNNAIKYSPQNSEIKVSASNLKEHIILNIQNTNVCISDMVRKKLFKEIITPENNADSGLSLFTCFQIMKLHKGAIKIINMKNSVIVKLYFRKGKI